MCADFLCTYFVHADTIVPPLNLSKKAPCPGPCALGCPSAPLLAMSPPGKESKELRSLATQRLPSPTALCTGISAQRALIPIPGLCESFLRQPSLGLWPWSNGGEGKVQCGCVGWAVHAYAAVHKRLEQGRGCGVGRGLRDQLPF